MYLGFRSMLSRAVTCGFTGLLDSSLFYLLHILCSRGNEGKLLKFRLASST